MIKQVFFFFLLMSTQLPGLAQSREQRIDDFCQALAQHQQFNGNVLIVEKGKIVYEQSFGYADIPARKQNTLAVRFPIASISKLLTATAILQLSEKGLVKTDDPVAAYLPAFPYSGITIRHLLSHTSGLPPYNAFFDSIRKADPARTFTNKDFLPGVIANKQALIYEPGEKGNYDNINYLLLALVIEKVSGISYERYIKKNILQPAGMQETLLLPLPEQFNRKNINNFAYPHVYLGMYDSTPVKSNSIPYVREYWHSYGFRGFADYISTVRDLWKFDKALTNHTLLRQATLNEAYIPVKLNNGENNRARFGLGWEIESDTSFGTLVYHSGAAMGLSSTLLRNVSREQVVILFDNSHFNAHENATQLMKLLNGETVDMPRKSIAKVYGITLLGKGPVTARDTLEALQKDSVNYYLSEDEMNSLGYDFMGNSNPYHLPEKHLYKEAVETLRMNTVLFPDSWNAYDSYGEALLADGQKAEAIKMYQKSVELNPASESGQKALQKLLQ